MNEQLAIYLWSISENIKYFLLIGGGFCLILGPIIAGMCSTDINLEDYAGSILKDGIIVGVLSIFLGLFIPIKQDLALIFVYPYLKSGAEQAIQSETVKKITTISSKYLDKVIADLEGGYNNGR